MRYTDVNSSQQSHISTLRGVIAFLCIVIVLLWFGWNGAKEYIRIHIPPDLRSGAVLKPDEINPANVYNFAGTIFQQLNYWEKDGEKDYALQIFALKSYFTPRYREYLKNDLEVKGKGGRLTGRMRAIHPVFGQGYDESRVDLIDADTWVVWIDYRIVEHVQGMEIKNVLIRYPIRIVRYDISPDINPWGLALDGFGSEGAKRLTEDELTKSSEDKEITSGD